MLVKREAYDKLMDMFYKGYSVPKAKGRYVDMGMSFKKNEEKSLKSAAPKRKPGELLELVFSNVTTRWQSSQDISYGLAASRESVRCCLEKLTKLGRIQSFGEHKQKQYRRVR